MVGIGKMEICFACTPRIKWKHKYSFSHQHFLSVCVYEKERESLKITGYYKNILQSFRN